MVDGGYDIYDFAWLIFGVWFFGSRYICVWVLKLRMATSVKLLCLKFRDSSAEIAGSNSHRQII